MPNYPANNCADILMSRPGAQSGYYWVRGHNGSAVNVYCEMSTNKCDGTRGWTRVVDINMADPAQQCPSGYTLNSDQNKRTCGRVTNYICDSAHFSTLGLEYSSVCGMIRAYQYSATLAFYRGHRSLHQNYLSGFSLTHGRDGHRTHIWSFAAGLGENLSYDRYYHCHCSGSSVARAASRIPSFVGNSYFCETGADVYQADTLYPDDPLWDGQGCGPGSTCCSLNGPPWFTTTISPTTDNLELRNCGDRKVSGQDTRLELLELYIR